MPCKSLPPFPAPPPLPPGVTIPTFTPPSLPSDGLCCNIQFPPPWVGVPPLPPISIALPQGLVAAYAEAVQGIQAVYDLVAIPCPSDNAQVPGSGVIPPSQGQ